MTIDCNLPSNPNIDLPELLRDFYSLVSHYILLYLPLIYILKMTLGKTKIQK